MTVFDYLRAVPRLKERPRLDQDLQREGVPLTLKMTTIQVFVIWYAVYTPHINIVDRVMAWMWVALSSSFFIAAWVLLARGCIAELNPLVHFQRNRK